MQRFILNDIHFLWREMPPQVYQMPQEERRTFCRSRFPVGSEFRGARARGRNFICVCFFLNLIFFSRHNEAMRKLSLAINVQERQSTTSS